MARPSPIDDPKTREFVIENLAQGMPQALIARAFQVDENTVGSWKKRKDFLRDLALKTLELATDPIKAVRKGNPLAYLERHPEFRENWGPKQNLNVDGKIVLEVVREKKIVSDDD